VQPTVLLTFPNQHVTTSQVTVSVYRALEHNKGVALSAGKFCGWAFICRFIGELLACRPAVHLQRVDGLYTRQCFLVTMLKLCHICANTPSVKALLMEIIGFWMVLTTFL